MLKDQNLAAESPNIITLKPMLALPYQYQVPTYNKRFSTHTNIKITKLSDIELELLVKHRPNRTANVKKRLMGLINYLTLQSNALQNVSKGGKEDETN